MLAKIRKKREKIIGNHHFFSKLCISLTHLLSNSLLTFRVFEIMEIIKNY